MLVYKFAEAGVHIEEVQMIQVTYDALSSEAKLGKTVLTGDLTSLLGMEMFNIFIHGAQLNPYAHDTKRIEGSILL